MARTSVIAEGPDDRGKAGNTQALGGQIGLLLGFLGVEIHRRQQGLQLAQALGARACRLRAAQNDAQIGLQSALDCVIK